MNQLSSHGSQTVISISNWVGTVPIPGARMRDNGAHEAVADIDRLFP
jgi:hypothetical protein